MEKQMWAGQKDEGRCSCSDTCGPSASAATVVVCASCRPRSSHGNCLYGLHSVGDADGDLQD
jgi:hypothetical protein